MKSKYKVIINGISKLPEKKKHLSVIYAYVRELRKILKLYKETSTIIITHDACIKKNESIILIVLGKKILSILVMLEHFTNKNSIIFSSLCPLFKIIGSKLCILLDVIN